MSLNTSLIMETAAPVSTSISVSTLFNFTVTSVTRKSIKWTWAELFEMNVKIEQELNFVVDNDSRLFLDAQEAKKVSERTVVR